MNLNTHFVNYFNVYIYIYIKESAPRKQELDQEARQQKRHAHSANDDTNNSNHTK